MTTLKLFVLFTAIFVAVAIPFIFTTYKSFKEVDLEVRIWL
jgi:hypothetical protein